MLGKNTAVFGIYPTYESLESAVDALRSSGFRNTDVSFLMAETVGGNIGHRKSSKAPEGVVQRTLEDNIHAWVLSWHWLQCTTSDTPGRTAAPMPCPQGPSAYSARDRADAARDPIRSRGTRVVREAVGGLFMRLRAHGGRTVR